jgi:hypothetical protein
LEAQQEIDIVEALRVMKKYGMDKDGFGVSDAQRWIEIARKYFLKMKERHDAYCTYPCFTISDVITLIVIRHLRGKAWQQAWDDLKSSFGNVSWNHFISEFNYVDRFC